MHKIALVMALVIAVLAPLAFAAGGLTLDTSVRFEFTDCSSSGSSSQSVIGQTTYLMRVTGEDVFVCPTSTCSTGGEKYPQGTVVAITVPGATPTSTTAYSCRSAASTGDVIFTKVR